MRYLEAMWELFNILDLELFACLFLFDVDSKIFLLCSDLYFLNLWDSTFFH